MSGKTQALSVLSSGKVLLPVNSRLDGIEDGLYGLWKRDPNPRTIIFDLQMTPINHYAFVGVGYTKISPA